LGNFPEGGKGGGGCCGRSEARRQARARRDETNGKGRGRRRRRKATCGLFFLETGSPPPHQLPAVGCPAARISKRRIALPHRPAARYSSSIAALQIIKAHEVYVYIYIYI